MTMLDEQLQNYSDKNEIEDLPKWEIAKLKYKCSITLISLLEARQKDDDIAAKMMKTLNIDVIKRNITDIYNQYIIIGKGNYNKDLFNHFEPIIGNEEHNNKCSFIIETGFNLFILLSTFKEINEDDQENQNLKKRKKRAFIKEFTQTQYSFRLSQTMLQYFYWNQRSC
ncbi:MIR domain protein [Ichthyophthirius multifiliis]|uniref:MIR domain protein n=1 Tax=Ichthyophthirius multifiliis TaxID=5932 RepID=G0QJC0_ICHMU|nr:MIR domain protein [Ichthyophthirius multifiliis]EGR34683.1 MIR domain protein [Ichthyophthirius multifiliis]|eukprot:XP_004039987.1 MIR domain protein [Ichthyophthirius multifiliis]